MKSINTLLVVTTFAFAGSTSFAQTADVSGVTTGTAATAASINALADAINALHTRVDALESDVSTIGDLVGNTYCLSFFGNIGGIDGGGTFARIGSYVGSGELTITSNVLGSITFTLDREFELGWNFDGLDSALDTTIDAYDWINGPVPAGESADGSGAIPVTIVSFNNNVLSTTIGGDADNFNVSSDGNMILNSNFSSDTEEGETNVIVGMRCPGTPTP